MKFIDHTSIVCPVFFILALLLFGPGTLYASDAPIHIEADRMTSTEQTNSVVFTGEVDAKQADVRIRSDEMTVYYTQQSKDQKDKTGEKSASQQVEKLVCIGNVEITRGEWLGTAKKMTYLSKERQVILTDNAKAWQNQNMVSGDKIIYYLDEGRSEVIGDSSATMGGSTKPGAKKPARVNMTIRQ
jgi:lipopolysaccharide export system protein LptA